MKKLLIAASLGLTLLMTAAMPEAPGKAQEGLQAPRLTLQTSNDSVVKLDDLKGKEIILHFWSKDDPNSRIENRQLDARTAADSDVQYIGVCIDKDEQNLTRQISVNDGNRAETQYYVSDLAHPSELDAYVDNGRTATYHINAQGIVTAID